MTSAWEIKKKSLVKANKDMKDSIPNILGCMTDEYTANYAKPYAILVSFHMDIVKNTIKRDKLASLKSLLVYKEWYEEIIEENRKDDAGNYIVTTTPHNRRTLPDDNEFLSSHTEYYDGFKADIETWCL
tara:strand:+ start:75 stop:461 length:387 start_codon:yes stop_codon:yes gene_type:complete